MGNHCVLQPGFAPAYDSRLVGSQQSLQPRKSVLSEIVLPESPDCAILCEGHRAPINVNDTAFPGHHASRMTKEQRQTLIPTTNNGNTLTSAENTCSTLKNVDF